MSEELKAIVEVIGSLGEEGARVFLWYLFVGFMETLLEIVAVTLVALAVLRFARHLIVTISPMDKLARELTRARGIGEFTWSEAVREAVHSRFWEKK